ncbi:MAG: ferredoxin [Candidatus Heimdallarchaeaceae archaeon]
MAKYKITIQKDECIGCGACYSHDPVHFDSDDEGYAIVKDGTTTDELSEGIFTDDDINDAKDAAESCPVEIIDVTDEE